MIWSNVVSVVMPHVLCLASFILRLCASMCLPSRQSITRHKISLIGTHDPCFTASLMHAAALASLTDKTPLPLVRLKLIWGLESNARYSTCSPVRFYCASNGCAKTKPALQKHVNIEAKPWNHTGKTAQESTFAISELGKPFLWLMASQGATGP